jgi:drug/metabolite transporter (DMT)-like permease
MSDFTSKPPRRGAFWPTLALATVAVAAGFNWIALRFLQARGMESAWAGLAVSLIGALALLPAIIGRAGRLDRVAFAILLTGLANGGALALYSASMLLTEVVRTLVLFYLAPMWGAFLDILLLGERLTAARVAAIGLCLAGMLAILGVDHGWPWPTNIGDWLAILSGLVYAYGSLRVYDAPQVSVAAQTFSTMIGSVVVSAIVLLLLPDAARGAPPPASAALWLMAAIYAVAMILPINWVALWSAQHLTPARVGLIFALEAVVGIVSPARRAFWLARGAGLRPRHCQHHRRGGRAPPGTGGRRGSRGRGRAD